MNAVLAPEEGKKVPETGATLGRPSSYTVDTAVAICSRLASGESLRSICRDENMPGLSTVYRWLADNENFRDQYARAREDQADTLADEILEIADDGRNDWMIHPKKPAGEGGEGGGGIVFNSEHVQRSRLRVDARKWIAAKLKPKKYGDRITQEHTGPGGGPVYVIGTTEASTIAKKLEEEV